MFVQIKQFKPYAMSLCFTKDWKPKPRMKNTRNLTWSNLICIFFQNISNNSRQIAITPASIASLQTNFGKLEHPLTLELKSKLNTSSYKTHACANVNSKPVKQMRNHESDTRNLTWRHLICIFFPKRFEQQATQAGRTQIPSASLLNFGKLEHPLTLELKKQKKYIYPVWLCKSLVKAHSHNLIRISDKKWKRNAKCAPSNGP